MSNWKKYNGALVPNLPPHIKIDSSGIEQKLKQYGAYFARWTSNFDCGYSTAFWYVICDKFIELDNLSRNTRNNTRRGLKRCTIKKVNNEFIINNCYFIYKAAFDNYLGHVKPKNEEDFKEEHLLYNDSKIWDFWVVYENKTNKIIAYTRNKIEYNQCELCTTKFHPSFLKNFYPSEALFYTMNTYYLNKKKFKYINDGARSISHRTNIQSFLIQKFKYRKAYCKLHVVYSKKIKFLIKIIYPFRFLIKHARFGLTEKLNVLITQEKIRRSYE